ncbi:MAG: SPOR domain-containing protein [Balneolaceae bacterium]
MKINRDKLIELLTEKTTMEAEEIETQLTELISRIRDAAEKGKALEIKGFGMFYISEEGELKFDSSDELETEINFKYAGMDPVELKKSRKETNDETGGPRKEEATAPGGKDSEGREKEGKKPVGAAKKPGEEAAPASSIMGMKKDFPPSRSEKPDQKDEKNPATTLITTIVTVLVIVIGIILALDFGFLQQDITNTNSGTSQTSPQQEDEAVIQPSEPTVRETDIADNEPSDPDSEPAGEEGEPVNQEPVESPAAEEEVEEVPEFGLYGTMQPIEGRYYSIVLHSLQNENDAREAGENLSSEGYRPVVANVNVAGIGPTWRVGIGQFESIPQAQQAARELPRRYRENSFIGLIQ